VKALEPYVEATSPASAAAVVPILMQLIQPHSVVDVGCGTGAWLREVHRQGVTDILGIDSGEMKLAAGIPFRSIDLKEGFGVGRQYDLAICLEVGEHLPARSAEPLVSSLTRAASIVAFSAAIPGQRGIGHVNEQWPDYWSALFAQRGYQQLDLLRARLWTDNRVAYWYRQNLFLYATTAWVERHLPIEQPMPQRIVHPELYARIEALSHPEVHAFGALVRALPHSGWRALCRRLSRGSRESTLTEMGSSRDRQGGVGIGVGE
jgi:hypothetical protein